MSRPNPTILFGFFVAVIVAICGASLLKGGVYIGKHEGDTLHMLEIVFRMASGEWPHVDFMTPIGALGTAPIALFVKLGFGIGMAFILAQTLVAIVLLLPVWWVAHSRLAGFLPYLFGLFVLVLATALVHGEAQPSISLSMHYNRWAWAISFVAIALSILPNQGVERPVVDGVIIGVAMAALVMLKVTYFAAFSLPVALALVLRGSILALIVAALTGLVVAGLITLAGGVEFWLAYAGDLLTVARSEIRAAPSGTLSEVVAAPAHIGGSLVLVLGVVFLRQAEQGVGGLILLLLVPGFFYVTYQNYANDPQWLLLMGVLLLAMLPETPMRNGFGWDLRIALTMVATAAFALASPSFMNLAYSPFRHFWVDVTQYSPMMPKSGVHADLYATTLRGTHVTARVPLDGPGTAFASYATLLDEREPVIFKGESLPDCEVELGLPAYFDTIVSDLEEAGFAQGRRLLAADLFSSHWLFGPLQPLKGGAPWYYGGLPGFDSADYLLVPLCPIIPEVRRMVLQSVEDAGVPLTEVHRTPLFILYEKG
ncbi:MAG: hypothetical protein WBN04_15410 [Paracoccaceae bacterium]